MLLLCFRVVLGLSDHNDNREFSIKNVYTMNY